jgi:hypothetical protein
MEDNLNSEKIVILPQYFDHWMTAIIFLQIGNSFNFWKMEGKLNILKYGRLPQCLVNGR